MAGEAVWTRQAELQLERYLDYLSTVRPAVTAEAGRTIRLAADQVAVRRGLARPARWDGLLERSVRRWRKLLVLEALEVEVRVLALYDMRQDLTAVDPLLK